MHRPVVESSCYSWWSVYLGIQAMIFLLHSKQQIVRNQLIILCCLSGFFFTLFYFVLFFDIPFDLPFFALFHFIFLPLLHRHKQVQFNFTAIFSSTFSWHWACNISWTLREKHVVFCFIRHNTQEKFTNLFIIMSCSFIKNIRYFTQILSQQRLFLPH